MNVAEFCCVTMGLCYLASQGHGGIRLKLKGDNKTSMVWSSEERFRTVLGFPVLVLFIAVCISYDFEVVEWEHVPSEENEYDALSRGARPADVGVSDADWIGEEQWHTHGQILGLCDPTTSFTSVEQFVEWWRDISACVSSLDDGSTA